MDCDTVRAYLDAYIDGELDLVTSLDVERHIADCAGCTERLGNRRRLLNALQSGTLRFQAPAGLQKRIGLSLPEDKKRRPADLLQRHVWLGMAAALVVGVVVTAALLRFTLLSPAGGSPLVQQIIDNHIRSLMVDHLADVVSSDRHTVKPWFDGKVDFSPSVIDLASQGFPLIGGRLEYLDGRAVSALVYQRQKHIINLYVWPSPAAEQQEQQATEQGYHVIHWNNVGAAYWAVSDLEMTELESFVRLIQTNLAEATPAPGG